jgi:hypothetical protein
VPDAHLAALAREHGLTVVSTDTDFARFPSVAWLNPVSAAALSASAGPRTSRRRVTPAWSLSSSLIVSIREWTCSHVQPPAGSSIDQSPEGRCGRASRARSRAAQSEARPPKPASSRAPAQESSAAARSADISSAVTASACSRIYPDAASRLPGAPIATVAVTTEASGLPRLPNSLSR